MEKSGVINSCLHSVVRPVAYSSIRLIIDNKQRTIDDQTPGSNFISVRLRSKERKFAVTCFPCSIVHCFPVVGIPGVANHKISVILES